MLTVLKLIYNRLRSIRNGAYSAFRSSRVKSAGVAVFVFIIAFFLYFALFEGLRFLVDLGGMGAVLIKKISFVLFFISFFMVAFSFAGVFYAAAFKSAEAGALMAWPLRREEFLSYKFFETFFICCWMPFAGIISFFTAYIFLGGMRPLVLCVAGFYVLPFLLISSFLGYALVIFSARFMNTKRFLGLVLLFVVAALFSRGHHPHPASGRGLFYFLSQDVAFFGTAQKWFLPFSWPGHGLIALDGMRYDRAFVYLANLWTLALFLLSCLGLFEPVFMAARARQFQGGYRRRRDWLGFLRRLRCLPSYLRAFLIKDIKFFLREPGLWLQMTVFFGILFFYFINFRRFSFEGITGVWKNILMFLNIFSLLSIICGMSLRFIFPQWSLEGGNFWIIKLAPVSLRHVFWQKFLLSASFLVAVADGLVFISSYMLELPPLFLVFNLVIVTFASLSLVVIALGMGAYFADFKGKHYLEAVESLGGFIALAVSFAYVIGSVVVFAFLFYFYFIRHSVVPFWVVAGALGVWILISLMLDYLVVELGLRRLSHKEY